MDYQITNLVLSIEKEGLKPAQFNIEKALFPVQLNVPIANLENDEFEEENSYETDSNTESIERKIKKKQDSNSTLKEDFATENIESILNELGDDSLEVLEESQNEMGLSGENVVSEE